MNTKDKYELLIVLLIVSTYCILLGLGKLQATSILPVLMYVVKKYLDGVEDKRNGGEK